MRGCGSWGRRNTDRLQNADCRMQIERPTAAGIRQPGMAGRMWGAVCRWQSAICSLHSAIVRILRILRVWVRLARRSFGRPPTSGEVRFGPANRNNRVKLRKLSDYSDYFACIANVQYTPLSPAPSFVVRCERCRATYRRTRQASGTGPRSRSQTSRPDGNDNAAIRPPASGLSAGADLRPACPERCRRASG